MDYETVEFKSQTDFRRWLTRNAESIDGIWIRIYKKASGIVSINYAQALDEALCFGWIDGMRKSYDEHSYVQKFTPRRKQSLWSKRNIEHIERLESAGLMTQLGHDEVQRAKDDGRWDAAYDAQSSMTIPDYFLHELDSHPSAKIAFESLNKTKKYSVVWSLQTAKTEATRSRRLASVISKLENGTF